LGAVVALPAGRELVRDVPRETACKALRAWAAGFDLSDVALILALPVSGVIDLMETDEWRQLRTELQPQIEQELAAQMLRVASSGVRQIQERVDQGEPQVDKMGVPLQDENGDPIRRRLSTRDLASVTTTVMNARSLLGIKESAEDKDKDPLNLREVADALKRFVRAKEITPTAD